METICGLVENVVNQMGLSRRELTSLGVFRSRVHDGLFVLNKLAFILGPNWRCDLPVDKGDDGWRGKSIIT